VDRGGTLIMGAGFDPEVFSQHLRRLGDDGQWRLSVFSSIDSTSSELVRRIRAAEGSATWGDVIVAARQEAGRGRQGRVWHSRDADNLYVSVSVEVTGNVADTLPLVPLCAGVSAVAALDAAGVSGVRLKWPNDLMLEGKKLGGILCEAPCFSPDRVIACVGLGLNLGRESFPPELAAIAISAGPLPGGPPEKEFFAAAWLHDLRRWVDRLGVDGPASLVAAWRSVGAPFGRRVRVGGVEGITVDLSAQGRLIVARDDGSRVELPGGVVEDLDTV